MRPRHRGVWTLALAAPWVTTPAAAQPAAGPLRAYAEAMAQGDYERAHEQLSDDDRRAQGRSAFVDRYRALERIPWLRVVLRSARVDDGKGLVAVDWSHTRFARGGLLADAEALARLPRRRYLRDADVRDGRLHLGLGASRPDPRGGSVLVASTSHDWFARYVRLHARCPRGARYLVVEMSSDGMRGESAFECTASAGSDEVVVDLGVVPREVGPFVLVARVVGIVPGRPPPDPFRAPEPELLARSAYPVVP